MLVRCLASEDSEAYSKFRLRMWPVHPSAGCWESVLYKYFRNPHVALCPGSGLYAYFQGEDILGILGAYPMPITLDGSVHAGHMMVDWAVLPERQSGPIAGHLWNTLLSLPGRKFGGAGSRASQRVLEKRAIRIPSTAAMAVLKPLNVLVLRALRLEDYAYPSPVLLDRARVPRGVQFQVAANFKAPMPFRVDGTAFVLRDRDFWSTYCSGRLFNGAIPLSFSTPAGEANVVIRLLEVGRFRYATLIAFQLLPKTVEHAQRVGLLLRKTLRAFDVIMLRLNDVDELTRALLSSLSPFVFRREAYWWGIRKQTDLFRIDTVRWWLTKADEDSHWAGFQPSTPRE